MKKRTFKTLGVCVLAGMIMASTMAMGVSALDANGKCEVTINTSANSVTGEYKIYKVATVTPNGGAFNYDYTDAFGSFENDYPLETVVAKYNGNESATNISDSADIQKYADKLAQAATILTPTVASGKLSENTKVDLEPGYYLVTIDSSNAGMIAAPSLIVVTNEDSKSVNAKTSSIPFEKKIAEINNGGSVSSTKDTGVGEIGATVTYNINTRLPKYAEGVTGVTDFVITDDPSDGIKYDINNDNMKVMVGDGVELTRGTDYTVLASADGFVLTIVDDVVLANGGKDVVVSFDATIDTDAAIGSAGNPNDASLVYGNDYATGGGKGTFDDEVTVYTTQITVNKTDGTNPLVGAGFTIKEKDTNRVIATINSTEQNPLSTFEFKGLDEGTYIIEETQVPKGFKKAADKEITITADKGGGNVEFVGTFNSGEELIEETVINTPGTSLPGTGGIGTTIFTVTGASLVVAAGAMLTVYLKKRKAEEK